MSMAAIVDGTVFGAHRGRVSEFDDHVGSGVVTGPDGRRHWFHCTAIADGSRTIDAGTVVRFLVVPGPTGLEASRIEPVPGSVDQGSGEPPSD